MQCPTRLLMCCSATFFAVSVIRTHVTPSFRHLSLNRQDGWGTIVDFANSLLHFSLFSTDLWDLVNSGLVTMSRHKSCLKGNPSEDTKWPEDVDHVQTLPLTDFRMPFLSIFRRRKYTLTSNLRSLGSPPPKKKKKEKETELTASVLE